MAFYLDGSKLVSDSKEIEYQVKQSFRKVLNTLPEDDPVPDALVMLGVLTEQLVPVEGEIDHQIQIVIENIEKTPNAEVSTQTVKGIQWLLSQVQRSLDGERKKAVGKLVTEAQLDTPIKNQTDSLREKKTTNQDNTSDLSQERQSIQTSDASSSERETTNSLVSSSTSPEKQTTTTDTRESNDKEQNLTYEKSTNAEGNTIECEFCSAGFQSESDAMSHSIRCGERPSDAYFTCKHCGNKYVSESALREHLEDCKSKDGVSSSKSNVTVYECENCGEEFDSPQERIVHKHSCSKSKSQTKRDVGTTEQLIERDATGMVANYIPDGGYGFIRTFDIDKRYYTGSKETVDVFFHVSEYPGHEPEEKDRLRFDVKQTEEGFKAVNISYADSNSESWDDTFPSKRPRWGTDI